MSFGAKGYFDGIPEEWDVLYSRENPMKYLFNRIVRRGLFTRFEFTFEQCGDLNGKSVLDLGCGTGRYSIECAKRGAKRVLGVDFAPDMVEFSKRVSDQMGVAEICEFLEKDVVSDEFGETFDVVLALGFFDYIRHPMKIFKKVERLKPHKFIASFPRINLKSIPRHIRYYWIRNCPVYNYSEYRIEELCEFSGFDKYKIQKENCGYLLLAECVK